MKKILFVAALLTSVSILSACSLSVDTTTRVLTEAGYTDIQVGGRAWFTCPQHHDSWSATFTAKGPTGQKVSGAVCNGGFFTSNLIVLN